MVLTTILGGFLAIGRDPGIKVAKVVGCAYLLVRMRNKAPYDALSAGRLERLKSGGILYASQIYLVVP